MDVEVEGYPVIAFKIYCGKGSICSLYQLFMAFGVKGFEIIIIINYR
jgi:hypothetical protein